jgi:glycosyltransferase involved in cell wall biosynthesis
MSQPLVTVVLPVRNGEAYLGEALESVRAQRYEPLEVIVVDGHSQDRSAAIAREFEAVRLLSQAGTGLANAWNQALAEARGDFVAFLSHDDRWADHKLVRQVEHLLQHPETAITHTWFRFVLQPGCVPPAGFRRELLDEVQRGRLMETMVARRRVFDEVGPFDERYPVAMDMDWFARTLDRRLSFDILPEVMLYKGVHADNNSNRIATNNADLLRLLRTSVSRKRTARESS